METIAKDILSSFPLETTFVFEIKGQSESALLAPASFEWVGRIGLAPSLKVHFP